MLEILYKLKEGHAADWFQYRWLAELGIQSCLMMIGFIFSVFLNCRGSQQRLYIWHLHRQKSATLECFEMSFCNISETLAMYVKIWNIICLVPNHVVNTLSLGMSISGKSFLSGRRQQIIPLNLWVLRCHE